MKNNLSLIQLLLEARVPYQQLDWFKRQPSVVQSVFVDCWLSNPFASRWVQLVENRSKGFLLAERRQSLLLISKAGYFGFKTCYIGKEGESVFSHINCFNNYGAVMDAPRNYDFIMALPETPPDYEAYLQSSYWKGVRLKVLMRDRNKCVKCGQRKWLNIHHKTYEHYKNELQHLEDLEALCRSCHSKAHSR